MRLRSLMLLSLLALACGSIKSSARPDRIPKPEIGIDNPGPIFFGSGQTAPVSLNVEVTNLADESIKLRRIRVESPGMVQYSLYPVQREYNDEIPPAGRRTFSLFATAFTNQRALMQSEPLSVRAVIDFEVTGTHFREVVYARNINAY